MGIVPKQPLIWIDKFHGVLELSEITTLYCILVHTEPNKEYTYPYTLKWWCNTLSVTYKAFWKRIHTLKKKGFITVTKKDNGKIVFIILYPGYAVEENKEPEEVEGTSPLFKGYNYEDEMQEFSESQKDQMERLKQLEDKGIDAEEEEERRLRQIKELGERNVESKKRRGLV